jgi:site-specific DNA-methyltransferase (adenine-specific)
MTSDEGDVILDPFVGTGTTAIAAKRLGRRFIGIDIDEKYIEIAHKKLKETQVTMINGIYISIFLNRVVTIRDKDWDKLKEAFLLPKDNLDIEKNEIKLKNINMLSSQKAKDLTLFEIDTNQNQLAIKGVQHEKIY